MNVNKNPKFFSVKIKFNLYSHISLEDIKYSIAAINAVRMPK